MAIHIMPTVIAISLPYPHIQMRTMLAKFRQAGVTSEELLEFVQRELIAMDERGTEN